VKPNLLAPILLRGLMGTFSREDFSYDQANDIYVCSGGKTPTTTGTRVNDGETLLYRASKADCDAFALRPRCCPNTRARKVPRSIHGHARDMARVMAKSWEGRASRRLRKKVEMLFAHLKRILKLEKQMVVRSTTSRNPPICRSCIPCECHSAKLRLQELTIAQGSP
jgi:Transposase DDE domain